MHYHIIKNSFKVGVLLFSVVKVLFLKNKR